MFQQNVHTNLHILSEYAPFSEKGLLSTENINTVVRRTRNIVVPPLHTAVEGGREGGRSAPGTGQLSLP